MTQEPTLDILYGAIAAHPRTVNFDFHGLYLESTPSWSVHITIDADGLRSQLRYVAFHATSVVSLESAVVDVIQQIDRFLTKYGEGDGD